MIQFSFADVQSSGKFKGFELGVDPQAIAIDGLNIAGYCQNQMDNKETCGAYIVLPIGYINKVENTEFDDIKKLASHRLRNKDIDKKIEKIHK